MNASPFFTIIIPTYNRAHLIDKAIRSVMAQSFCDWELIIVDDGSTDNTAGVIFNFQDERIRYFYKKNEERSVARNYGTREAKGKYLCFLDSDDYFLVEHLAIHFQNIEKEAFPIAGFYSGTYMENGKLRKEDRHLFSGDQVVKTLWKYGYNLLPFSFHRDIFKSISFSKDLIYMEDLHLLLSVFKSFTIFPIFQNTNVVVIHEGRTTTRSYKTDIINQGKKNLYSIDTIIRDHGHFLLQHLSQKEIKKRRKIKSLSFAKACLKRANILGALYFLLRYFFKGSEQTA